MIGALHIKCSVSLDWPYGDFMSEINIPDSKHGQAGVELRPLVGQTVEGRRAVVARMEGFQAKHDLKGVSLRALIDTGRKYG